MSTSSNTSLSCTGCLNCCCKNNKYEISKEAMTEIAAFRTFLEQFHQKKQQNPTKTSQDTNHQLTKSSSPETIWDEWMEETVKCGQVSGQVRNRLWWLFLFWRGAPAQRVRCQIKNVKKVLEHSDLYTINSWKVWTLIDKNIETPNWSWWNKEIVKILSFVHIVIQLILNKASRCFTRRNISFL